MKNSNLRIFTTMLSVIGSFALLPEVKAAPEVAPPPGRDAIRISRRLKDAMALSTPLPPASANTGISWRSLFSVRRRPASTPVLALERCWVNTSDSNTAVGAVALLLNTTGGDNTAVGAGAMENGNGGDDNTAVGEIAGLSISGNSNTVSATRPEVTRQVARVTSISAHKCRPVFLANLRYIRIGNDTAFTFPYDTFIAGIFNRDVSNATAQFVFVDDTGKLGTNVVDANGNNMATPQAMLDESLKQQKRIAELENDR